MPGFLHLGEGTCGADDVKVNGASSRFGRFLKRLRSDYLGLAVIMGVFGGGLVSGWTVSTWFAEAWQLPDRIESQEYRLNDLEDARRIAERAALRSSIMIAAFCEDPPTEATSEACSIVDFLERREWAR